MLKVKNTKNVWAIGDCVYSGNPPTAQVAYQQGKYIAMRINNIDKKQDDFKFDNKGISIYTGLGYYYTELIINNNNENFLIFL